MLRPRLPEIFLRSTVISSGLTQFMLGDRKKLSCKRRRQKQVPHWSLGPCYNKVHLGLCCSAQCGGNTRTCVRKTSRGTWSLLPVFGVIITETISSRLSSPDFPSAVSVVCDPKFFSTDERTLLGLTVTVGAERLLLEMKIILQWEPWKTPFRGITKPVILSPWSPDVKVSKIII